MSLWDYAYSNHTHVEVSWNKKNESRKTGRISTGLGMVRACLEGEIKLVNISKIALNDNGD